MNLKTILAVGGGGVIGTLLRYLLTVVIVIDSGFPMATLLINLSGCFILSFLLTFFGTKWDKPPLYMTALSVGILGSFTTFSTFIVEVVFLWPSKVGLAFIYCLGSLVGGLLFALFGYYVAHKLIIR